MISNTSADLQLTILPTVAKTSNNELEHGC